VGRCLIPASHFFEFTGSKPSKSKWKFTKVGEEWFCFAGLWRPMPESAGEAFTLLTTEPGPDVAPIHARQMVVLERKDWFAWLDLTRPEAELPRPLLAGSLTVEQVR
jgi:putative SOS response-associated peptidase YedK